MSLCNATIQQLIAAGLSVIGKCPVEGCGYPVARHRDEYLARAGGPEFDLTSFLWHEPRTSQALFPSIQFGLFVLNRQRVVETVKAKIASYRNVDPTAAPSVYLSGCRGSGKTSLLMLLGRSFQAEGYKVFHFKIATAIPRGIEVAFQKLLESSTQKVAVLIDEVEADPNAALFATLLKGEYPHLVTIGAAVPRYASSGKTSNFVIKMPMSEIVFRETDDDFQQLINYCVERNVTTPELTTTICRSLLEECGGHAYPTLKFIEHFFTSVQKEDMASIEAFREYLCGPKFAAEGVYKLVTSRCFDLRDAGVDEAAFRVLRGKEQATDIVSLAKVGLWNEDTQDFISRLFVNTLLSEVQLEPAASAVYVDDTKSHEENTVLVIAEGLSSMEQDDFYCMNVTNSSRKVVNVENAVSFNWAYRVRSRVPNAHLRFQERGTRGLVDFYLNGSVGTAIEVLVNATRTVEETSTRSSQDIDGHAERFVNGAYPWPRYALFNFALDRNEVVLPRDQTMWDKTYTFVYNSNALYRGRTLIKANVARKLKSGTTPPTFSIGKISPAESSSQRDTATDPPSMISTVGSSSNRKGKGATQSTAPKTPTQQQQESGRQEIGQKTRAKAAGTSEEDDNNMGSVTYKRPPSEAGPEQESKRMRK